MFDPAMSQMTNHDTTLVTASTPSELSPIEAAIMDTCNEVHEARSTGDDEGLQRLRDRLESLLLRYDETDGESHPNSAWARPNQRALALSALGETSRAVQAELIALKYADTPRRLEISLGNLAERYIRLGEYGASLTRFLEAIEVAPTSVPVMLTGAQAMYYAGHLDEANRIFAAFLDLPEQFEPTSELIAYLDHESRLVEMAADLPALRDLLARRAQLGSEGGRS